MSYLKNKLSLKTFGLEYSFEYDFKCHYNTIAPGQLIPYSSVRVNYTFLNKKTTMIRNVAKL